LPRSGLSTRRWGAEALRLARAVALSCGVAFSLNLGVALADPGGQGNHGNHGNPHGMPATSQAGNQAPAPGNDQNTGGQNAGGQNVAGQNVADQNATLPTTATAPDQAASTGVQTSQHGNGHAYGLTKHAQDEGNGPRATSSQVAQPAATQLPDAGGTLSSSSAPGTAAPTATPIAAPSSPTPSGSKPAKAKRPTRRHARHRAPGPRVVTGSDAVRRARRAGPRAARATVTSSSRPAPGSSFRTRHAAPAPAPARLPIIVHRRPESSAPAILPTLTKIIGVVPLPIRVAMGVLVALALGLGASSRLTALRAGRLERQRRQLLEDVGLLQAALLPVVPRRLGQVATSVAYRPADGPGAGGDFYDVFALDDGRIAVILGDLSGHGRHALPHTALVRFTLRAYLESGLSPRTALQNAAAVLERQLGESSFATVIVGTYDPGSRRLVYASAGHSPPLILSPLSLNAMTVCCSPPLGLAPRTGTRQTTVALPGSAVVCFCTDGLAEARTGTGRVGMDGLERTLAELAPGAGAQDLLDAIASRSRECSDDMAACMLRIDGRPMQAVVMVEEIELHCDEAPAERARRFLDACGVPSAQIDEFLSAAAETMAGARDLVLEVTFGPDGPQPKLRRPDVPVLHPPPARGATRLEVAI
jgi:serine phosphatase RsbU (regulator of sigma subunit)